MLSSQLEVKSKYEEKLKNDIKKELMLAVVCKVINKKEDMDQLDMAIEGHLGIDRRKVVVSVLEEILVDLKNMID